MSRAARLLLFAILTGAILVGITYFADAPPNDAKEQARLQGTWQVVAIVAGGKPMAATTVRDRGLRYVFDGDTLTIHRRFEPPIQDKFVLDATTTPRRITIARVPAFHGVYELEGDELKLCFMMDGQTKERFPKALESTASPITDLLTLERRP